MFQLRKETDYAIQFLKALHLRHGRLLSLREAAALTGVSFLFLQKIARKLRQAKIIAAVKGVEGGYRLSGRAADLSLKKIIEVIEGKCGLIACLGSGGVCVKKARCKLKAKMGKVDKKIMKIFKRVKLAEL